jgi:hypothetical protein
VPKKAAAMIAITMTVIPRRRICPYLPECYS